MTELKEVLKPRDYEVLKMYTLGELTQAQIASQIGITRSYISRIMQGVAKKGVKIGERMGVI